MCLTEADFGPGPDAMGRRILGLKVGEAPRAFLFALATGQLKVTTTYVSALYKEFAEASGDEVWGLYWSRIREGVL